jgi:hypothetical protein
VLEQAQNAGGGLLGASLRAQNIMQARLIRTNLIRDMTGAAISFALDKEDRHLHNLQSAHERRETELVPFGSRFLK